MQAANCTCIANNPLTNGKYPLDGSTSVKGIVTFKSIALQPVSVMGDTGIYAGAGIASMSLDLADY